MELSGHEEYAFLAGLTRLIRPRRVLEIGTSLGYGTLNFARNMPSGSEIWTIDIEDIRCDELKRYSGDVRIVFLKGRSQDILKDLIAQKKLFDFAFIDGDHHYSSVKQDWLLCSQLTSNVIFHDVLQFQGVYRVIQEVHNNDILWDVITLSYPPITMQDIHTKLKYQSNKVPGLAIATKHKDFPEKVYSPLDKIPENAFILNKFLDEFITLYHNSSENNDLNFFDLKMIYYLLNNIQPDIIINIGHVGTVATKLFMFYLINSTNGLLCLWDISNKFWKRKKIIFPQILIDQLNERLTIYFGLNSYQAIQNIISKDKKIIFWIDEWESNEFYNSVLPLIIHKISGKHIVVVRNFSPDDGNPAFARISNSQSTNPNAFRFVCWLKKYANNKTINFFQASPDNIFGDYVNCGHWIYIRRI